MLTIAALALLSTVLVNFYRLLGATGDDIASGQDGILATTITTSYMEIANGLAFDEVTDTTDEGIGNVSILTSSGALGREVYPDGDPQDSIHKFNDFDDFNNYEWEKQAGTTGRRYKTRFVVNYVNPNNVQDISAARTFVKRMDLKTWRSWPLPRPGANVDTLNLSLVMGYFHFD
jgi:hypothetical protein